MEGVKETIVPSDITGVGQAAEIIKWMRNACPDMLPMAPLLEDMTFTGFAESRYTILLRTQTGVRVGYGLGQVA